MKPVENLERTKIGKRSGAVGVICNLLLSVSKISVGLLVGSMAIVGDGLNNLSDATSALVTLIGFKLAERPADKEHPYGHARFEYVAGLTVAMLILFVGFELAKTSVEKIIRPTPVEMSALAFGVLIASVFVKLFMMLYNRHMGKKIQSNALLVTATDNRNDVIATSAVALAMVVEHFANVRIDGAMGLFVAIFILYSGVSMIRETVSPLLGEGADPALRKRLTDYIGSCPMVMGCHDLMVHDYGPGERYASIHVEMDAGEDVLRCHEAIDRMERECLDRFGVHLVIHHDPMAVNDPEIERFRQTVVECLKEMDPRLEMHDFRVLHNDVSVSLAFDVILPEDLSHLKDTMEHTLAQALQCTYGKPCTLCITFDLQ